MKNDDLGIPEWLVELREVSRGCSARGARLYRVGAIGGPAMASDIAIAPDVSTCSPNYKMPEN